MHQSLRLSEDAVKSSKSYSISSDALAALQAGDTTALIASHRERFGGWKLMAKDDDDDDENDDDDLDDNDSDDDDSGDGDDDDSDDDQDDDDDGPEGKKSKKAKKPEGDPQRKIAALEDEKNRLFRGRERARQERDDLRAELERVKKDGTGDDQLKEQVSTLEKSNESLTSDLRKARLQIAFLSDNTYEWHDPGVALASVKLSDLEIDDDGTVHGLKSALETLAESKPFLLKTEKKDTTKKRTTSGTPSGQPSRSRPNKTKQAAERQRVAEKYGIKRGRA